MTLTRHVKRTILIGLVMLALVAAIFYTLLRPKADETFTRLGFSIRGEVMVAKKYPAWMRFFVNPYNNIKVSCANSDDAQDRVTVYVARNGSFLCSVTSVANYSVQASRDTKTSTSVEVTTPSSKSIQLTMP